MLRQRTLRAARRTRQMEGMKETFSRAVERFAEQHVSGTLSAK
jgi:hypothetical protein